MLRTTPCLFGLFSVVALIFAEQSEKQPVTPRQVPGYAKVEPTFADALAAVRQAMWEENLKTPLQGRPVQKPPPSILATLLEHLSYAA